jgi:putative Mg2+ transporter-C (MgtC) family protein
MIIMNWLINDWHQLLTHPWLEILLVVDPCLCGAMIGIERERKLKPVGLRTMILICLGSTIFTLISPFLETSTGESGRVAAQVVSGIGFLGAGAIIQGSSSVRGLTSAALIWATAAIGMVIGAGLGGAGFVLSILLLLILTIVSRMESRYLGPCVHQNVTLVYNPLGGKTDVKIDHILNDFQLTRSSQLTETIAEDRLALTINYCNAHKHHRDFLVKLADLAEVESIARLN